MRRIIRISITVIIVHAAAFSPAAFAVSTVSFLAEAGVGTLCGSIVSGAGIGLAIYGEYNDNGALAVAGVALMAAYPAATATGVYFTGEAVDGPSANKFAAWGLPTLAAYGATVVVVGGTIAAGAGHIGVIVDVVTKPFLTAWVYNWVKKPAAAGESRGPNLAPYVAVTTTGNGAPMPVYGVTLSF